MMWYDEVEVDYYELKIKISCVVWTFDPSLSLGVKSNSKFKSDLGIERDTLQESLHSLSGERRCVLERFVLVEGLPCYRFGSV